MKLEEIEVGKTYANEDGSEVYRVDFVEKREILFQVFKPLWAAKEFPFQRMSKKAFAAWAHHEVPND